MSAKGAYLVSRAFNLKNQIESLHWQTTSLSEHEAYGRFYKNFTKLNDKLIESYSGKYGRYTLLLGTSNNCLTSMTYDINVISVEHFIKTYYDFYSTEIYQHGIISKTEDPELDNIVMEILTELNSLKYFYTMDKPKLTPQIETVEVTEKKKR